VIEGQDPVFAGKLAELVGGRWEGMERLEVGVGEGAEGASGEGFAGAGGSTEDEDGIGAGGAKGGEEPGEAAEAGRACGDAQESEEVIEGGGRGVGFGLRQG